MIKTVNLFEIDQPVGTFYLGKIKAKELLSVFDIKRISQGLGSQRDANRNKINKIESYCKDNDRVTFPTPIIVSIDSDSVELTETNGICKLEYDDKTTKFNVIDGQHRLLGIEKSNIDLDLPIVVMLDLTPEDEAYIFTTINQNQTKVDKSVIYSLFELSNDRSPIKTCHDIAVIMNETPNYPFYKRIKMLGKRKEKSETLSQAAFIDYLMPFFVPNKEKSDAGIFYNFYIENKDANIVKILNNYFSAIKNVFKQYWDDPTYNLTKTTGYGSLCKVLPELYKIGQEKKDLTESFFESLFTKVKEYFDNNNIRFIAHQYGSGDGAQKELAKRILEAINNE